MTEITPSRLADLLTRHGVNPARRLGQHFLVDLNLVRKIVRTAGVGPGDRVLEIGAGVGNLTAALAGTGAKVVAYEIDHRLAPILVETVTGQYPEVEIRMEDASKVDWSEALGGQTWVMVSNLPYGVGTSLVLEMLQQAPGLVRFVVMLQREVVQRITASPGSRQYGLPSVIAGLHSRAKSVFDAPPQVFFPRPKVSSSVVELERITPDPDTDLALSLAASAFRERRKMLRRSLRFDLVEPERMLTEAEISPRCRPESLAPQAFLRLARVVRAGEAGQ